MINLNMFTVSGNLAGDPVTSAAGDTTVTRGTIIHSESYKDSETQEWKQTDPVSFEFEIWGGYGKAFEDKSKKGSFVILEGKFRSANYEKPDGEKVYRSPRLKVESWHLIPPPRPDEKGGSEKAL